MVATVVKLFMPAAKVRFELVLEATIIAQNQNSQEARWLLKTSTEQNTNSVKFPRLALRIITKSN